MKIGIKMTQKQANLYKKLGADPEVILNWIHKEITKILENNHDVYGTINNLDEEDLAEWIILSAKLKKNNRLKIQADNKHKAEQDKKKKERLGKSKRSKFYEEMAKEI
jgi:hypothetical protein